MITINYKNYNFREKKNNQVMKERGNLHQRLTTELFNVSQGFDWFIYTATLNAIG